MSTQLIEPVPTGVSRLTLLRSQLVGLRRRRQSTRLSAAWMAVGLAVLWTLVGLFLLDWQLSMSRAQRLVGLLIGAGVVAWTYRRFAAPLLARRESDLDVALLVQRERGIDSDLVAALQFESPEAARWGSRRLERAVIDWVGQYTRRGDLTQNLVSARQSARRGIVLAATVAGIVAAVICGPQYAGIFLLRMAFGSWHYPTRTSIDEVRVNGAAVEEGDTIRVGYGEPVRFAVYVSGEIPTQTRKIVLRAPAGGVAKPIELTASVDKLQRHVFFGQAPQVVDTLDYQVYLGDAWTDPSRLVVVPAPIVDVRLTGTAPEYARAADAAHPEDAGGGTREVSVLEGSRVDVRLECANKRLQSATLTIGDKHFQLHPTDDEERIWTLPPENSPLARVAGPVKCHLQVADEDGMALATPIYGYIHTRPDRPPLVSAAVDVQYFLPNSGAPQIQYAATDDYGLSRLRLFVRVIHEGAAREAPKSAALPPESAAAGETSVAESLSEPIVLDGPQPDRPILRSKLPLRGMYRLSLAQFKLVKGDQVQVVIEATDYRGDAPGKSSRSEPVVLHITDEAGIMAALGEADARAAQQLDALIQRQTETGGSK